MIDPRLSKVIKISKPGLRIPIIVETRQKPSPSDIQELRGYMNVARVSKIVNHVYGSADANAITSVSKSHKKSLI